MRSFTLRNEEGSGLSTRRSTKDFVPLRLGSLLACGVLALSCGDSQRTDSDQEGTPERGVEAVVAAAATASCAPPAPVSYPIIVAQNVTAGYVTVANSCTGLTFTAHLYEPSQTTPAGRDLVFEGIAIDVQTAFPPVKLAPGKLAYQYAYATPSRADFSQTIPFTAFGLPADVCAPGAALCGAPLGILFHLKIRETRSDGTQLTQAGWAGDGSFTGRSWGYYMGFTPCCTCRTTPAPALASNCDGSLHYSVDGVTCHWTFESGGTVIGSSDSCAGDLTVSLPAGSDVDATVHVVTAEGCTGDASTSATTIVPLEAEITSENLTCEASSTGTVTAAATGGTGPYTFSWSNGATTETIVGVPPGEYTVTIQDASACTAEASVTLTGRVPLSVEVSSDAVACGGGSTGSAVAIPAGGVAPYSYLWSNGETTPTLAGVAAGEYGVTVTDASGCIAIASVTVTQPPSLGVAITSGNVACFGGASGSASVVPSGGVGPYTFLWSNGATGASLEGAPAGDYGVTVTDSNGCSAAASVTVSQPPVLAVAITSNNVACFDGASGNATAVPTGGTGPFTFLWSNGATGASISGVPAGSYNVTIADANGCPASASVTINEPPVLAVSITSDSVECSGGASGNATAVPTGGTGPFTYLWSNGATGASIGGVPAGSYTVTVTDAKGCPTTASVTINEPPALAVDITSGALACFGDASGNATAVPRGGSGPYTFLWSNGASGSSISGVPAGEYGVTVTDANGCPATASVTIAQPPALAVEITSDAVACFGGASGNATAVPSGGSGPFTFLWSNGATGASLNGVPAGNYSVTVTDANGCPASASVSITQPPALAVQITSDNVECSGGASGNASAVPSGGSGPYTFRWSNGATGASLNGVPAGEYGVTVTDANGCPATASVTITQPLALAVEISSDAVACFGGVSGSANVLPSGGVGPYTFVWSNGATGASLPAVPAGDYSVTVTDANGCPASGSVSITQPPVLAVSIASDNVECFGGASGNATAVPSGGTGQYTFVWSTGATGQSLSGIGAGEYGVTVTDTNGCPANARVSITQPPALAVEITSDDVECAGGATGNASAQANGGVAPYTFNWSNGATGPSLPGVPAGEYRVTVSDANSCPATASVTVTQPPVLSVQVASDNVECFGGATGNASAQASGGTGPYAFTWSTGATGQNLSGVPAGEYGVTVTDGNGCPGVASVTVTQPPPLTVDIRSSDVACFGETTGNATAQASGGIGPYTFIWSTGAQGETLAGVGAGEYAVLANDANECPAGASVTITQPPALGAGIDAGPVCGGLFYEAWIAGGTVPLTPTVTVTGPDGFSSQSPELAGLVQSPVEGPYTASLEVVDGNGCRFGASDTVEVFTVLAAFVEAHGSCPADGDLHYTFASTVIGGSAHLVYEWVLYGDGAVLTTEPPVTDDLTEGKAFVSLPGDYYAELTVVDPVTGCVASDTNGARVYAPLEVTLTASTNSLVCPMETDNVTFAVEVIGGSGSYAITWEGEQPGDTCLDGTTSCAIHGNGYCDSRSITATASDPEAPECAAVTSAPGIYEKKTTVTASTR